MHRKLNLETILGDDLRAVLAADATLGCGNFLRVATKVNPAADAPFFFTEKGESYSLNGLQQMADELAAFYHGNGIVAKDPVAVYIGEGILNLVQYIALTSLGAIPVLINGNMRPEYAAGFVKKVGAVALYSDTSHLPAIRRYLDREPLRFVATDESAPALRPPSLPARFPYVHHDLDPVLIGHSSGTTGIPKAVVFQHQQFFHGVRYRLSQPRLPGSSHILSALPHSHSAGIAYVMLAVLSGTPVVVLSGNRPEVVLPAIDRFRPTMVAAFPQTYVELTEADYARYDLSSVRLWVNGGDAAHETHIRRLVGIADSKFIDGLGSSEMGFSLFRAVHTAQSNDYERCIGVPLEWVDAAVLGEDGEKLPPYRVGKLGVRAPSITAGYWNDSVLTARTRVNGYWLTGDLFYHDEKGRFFHVDRIPDAIRTRQGMVYSLQTEELLMKHCTRLGDITVAAVPAGEGYSAAIALVRLREGTFDETALREELNAILVANGKPPSLTRVLNPPVDELPLGPTGKVLKREVREKYQNLLQGGRHV